jgi:AcrR family transcriptional regulator
MTTTVRPYRGVSAQDRVAERRANLIEACLDLVGEHGPVPITVEAICQRAGLTKRYFYESFRDRDAAMFEILDGLLQTIEHGVLTSVRDAAPLDRSRIMVELIVSSLQEDPRKARLYAEANAVEALRLHREQAMERYVVLLREVVLPFADHSDQTRVARDVISRVIVHGSTATIAAWLSGGFVAARADLVDGIIAGGMAAAGAVEVHTIS